MPDDIELTPEEIVDALRAPIGLPVDVLALIGNRRAELVPVFLGELKRFVAEDAQEADELEPEEEEPEAGPVALIFHLLASWREKSAYRLMLDVLRADPLRVTAEFGGMLVETVPRAVASVFEGDLAPICEAIRDEDADEMMRAGLLDVFLPLVGEGVISREQASEALKQLREDIEPQAEHLVWLGWVEVVAVLGLDELKAAALAVFRHGWVDPELMRPEDFNRDFAEGRRIIAEGPDADDGRWSLFTDVEGELAEFFEPDFDDSDELTDIDGAPEDGVPVLNPFRHVGRNDPCPCGSGKKFKKCCGA
jgi:hypothetical protein